MINYPFIEKFCFTKNPIMVFDLFYIKGLTVLNSQKMPWQENSVTFLLTWNNFTDLTVL